MTLFEALPDDITKALFSYCKDDECLNDAMLRALRNELKIDQVEHDKYSHDCFRCDKFKEFKNEVTAQIAALKKENEELWTHSAYIEGKIAKATEIIKDLLLMAKVENLERNYESVDEAKQFLAEVKK